MSSYFIQSVKRIVLFVEVPLMYSTLQTLTISDDFKHRI